MPGRAGHPLARHASDFLTDLSNANASAHRLRAYRGDLLQFCAHHDSEVGELTVATVRGRRRGADARDGLRRPNPQWDNGS